MELALGWFDSDEEHVPVAPVSGLRGSVGIRLSPVAGFRAFRFFKHGAGLFRVAQRRQHCRQGMQGALEFVAISLAQWRFSGSIQHPVQFVQVHIDTTPFGGLHPMLSKAAPGPRGIA